MRGKNPRRLRVTFVHTSSLLNLRGSERWLLDVCALLHGSNFDIRVVNFDYDEKYARTREEKIRRHEMIKRRLTGIDLIELHGLRLKIPTKVTPFGKSVTQFINDHIRFLPLSKVFFNTLRTSDVIYFLQCQRSPVHLLVVLTASALAGRKPVIAGIHVTRGDFVEIGPRIEPYHAALLKFFVKLGVLKAVHAVNQRTAPEMQNQIGCPSTYIPNGIFFDRFKTSLEDKMSQRIFGILFVGAMSTSKGADMLPEIYAALKKRNMKFDLSICSPGGPLLNQIQSWASGKSDVRFRGYVSEVELRRLYNQSSVALFPSRKEAWGLACVEAQASGTPVVVSDIMAFRQTVIDGRTGFLTANYQGESFVEDIDKIYSIWGADRTRYFAICKTAQDNVRDNFQWGSIAARLGKLLISASN